MKKLKLSIATLLMSTIMMSCAGGDEAGESESESKTCTGKTEVAALEYDNSKKDFDVKGVRVEESSKYTSLQILLVNYDTDDITISNIKEGDDKLISIRLMSPKDKKFQEGVYTVEGGKDAQGRIDFYIQESDQKSRAYNHMNFDGKATVTIFEMSNSTICGNISISSKDITIKADFQTDNINKVD